MHEAFIICHNSFIVMLKNYLIVALRNFWKRKFFTAINTIGLALGLSCSLMIYIWVSNELQYDTFHTNGEDLFLVSLEEKFNDGSASTQANTPANWYPFLKKLAEVKEVTRIRPEQGVYLKYEEESFAQQGLAVDPSFLNMLSFPLLQGNPQTALQGLDGIVITQQLAEKLFANQNPLGEIISLQNQEGEKSYQISGVIDNQPALSSLEFDFLLPFEEHLQRNDWLNKWGSYSTFNFVQLHPQASVEEVNQKLISFTPKHHPEESYALSLFAFPELYLYGNFDLWGITKAGNINNVYLFSAISVLVLLIACINFINLTTAGSAKRAKEVGVRKTMGAQYQGLVFQFLIEVVFIILAALVIALLSMQILLPTFNQITQKELSIPLDQLDFLLAIFIILFVTIVLSGLYPSLVLSRYKAVQVLKGKPASSHRWNWLREGLVIFQFVLSLGMIICTLTVYEQIQYMQQKELGMDKEQVIYFNLDSATHQHFDVMRRELLQQPSIEQVALSSNLPFEVDNMSSDVWWEGKPEDDDKWFRLIMVDAHFLESMRIPLVEGRGFSSSPSDSTVEYMVNEAFLEYMQLEDPIGQSITSWKGEGELVGIVKDFHTLSLHSRIDPLIFMYWPEQASIGFIRTAPGQTRASIEVLESIFHQYSPSTPLEYHFLDERYAQLYEEEKRISTLAQYFTWIAVLVASLGLLGLATFITQERTKEVGIRKVLGASVSSVLLLLSKDYIKLIVIALFIAIPIANYFLREWLNNFAYKIEVNWWLFALPGVMVLLIAMLSISSQTLKAARQNPVDSLRYE